MSWFTDLLYNTTGITINETDLALDPATLELVGGLFAAVAFSDGDFSPDESSRIVQIFTEEFQSSNENAISLLRKSFEQVKDRSKLTDLIAGLNQRLSVPQKRKMITLLLHVINADQLVDAREKEIFKVVIDAFRLSEDELSDAYLEYHQEKGNREQ